MDRFRVTKRFEFDSAHRLYGYDGPCGQVHGHRYALEITLEGKKLDEMGMLFDFTMIKSLIQPLIDEWDHSILLYHKDPLCGTIEKAVALPTQPTAEVMARLVWWYIVFGEGQEMRLANVRVYETPDCWVDYSDV